MPRPIVMPMAEANTPSTMVLAIACFSDGHTGRLPTIDTPQSPRDEVAQPA